MLTGALVALVAVAWHFFAPSNIGGSTRYVVTSGVSMQPHFHTGDLAITRPASTYRVGDVVAYHSTLLHVTVLHRIIARHGNRYVFGLHRMDERIGIGFDRFDAAHQPLQDINGVDRLIH